MIDTAVGYQERTDAVTQGWARIIPGKCANIYPHPLTGAAYYLYAKSSQVHSGPGHAWGGNVRLCAKGENFILHEPLIMETCPEDSFIMPFSRVDPKGRRDWSTVLTESPMLSSFELARQAGIVRLLIDAGYKITADPKTANAALWQLRARASEAKKRAALTIFSTRCKASPREPPHLPDIPSATIPAARFTRPSGFEKARIGRRKVGGKSKQAPARAV